MLIEPGQELEPVEATAAVRQEDFRKLVGKIQWLAVVTRPDITYVSAASYRLSIVM
jgi:hypothetical protein